VGKSLTDGKVEIRERKSGQKEEVLLSDVVQRILN
jgi:hypothetical protein